MFKKIIAIIVWLNSKWFSQTFEKNNLPLNCTGPSCFSQGSLLSLPYQAVDAGLTYSSGAMTMHLQEKSEGKIFGIR